MKKQFEVKSDKHRWLVDIDEELMEQARKDNPKATDSDIINQIIDEARDEISTASGSTEGMKGYVKLREEGHTEGAVAITKRLEGTDLSFTVSYITPIK